MFRLSFAEQILAYQAGDAKNRPGGLVLGSRGDFCNKVHRILKQHGRERDYFEISLDARVLEPPV